jgi:hypothetical protein
MMCKGPKRAGVGNVPASDSDGASSSWISASLRKLGVANAVRRLNGCLKLPDGDVVDGVVCGQVLVLGVPDDLLNLTYFAALSPSLYCTH